MMTWLPPKINYFFWRYWVYTKQYEIEWRYNWRCQPYHMIIHALKTVLHLNKNYLTGEKLGWITQTKTFWDAKILAIQCIFSNGVPHLQSMNNHMVGRAGSIPFPLFSILLGWFTYSLNLTLNTSGGFDKFKHAYLLTQRTHKGFKGTDIYIGH